MTVWHLISLTNIVCAVIGGYVGSRARRLPTGFFAGLIGGPFGLVWFLLRQSVRRPARVGSPSVSADPLLAPTVSPTTAYPQAAYPVTRPEIAVPTSTSASNGGLNIPVQVLIAGTWTDGTLDAWRQGPTQWEGSVTYRVRAGSATGWFPTELVRRSDAAADS